LGGQIYTLEPNDLLTLLRAAPSLREFIQTKLLGAVPWIFKGDVEAFQDWRRAIAREAAVQEGALFVVGSAAVGFSLSPMKPGRPFQVVGLARQASDIDIAIVDAQLFEQCWNTLVRYDRARGLGGVLARPILQTVEKMRLDVYWGMVSHSNTVPGTDEARRLRLLFAATSRRPPFLGHEPRARVYRRLDDLISYHEVSLRQLVETLREGVVN
jgi:hypothetical protein